MQIFLLQLCLALTSIFFSFLFFSDPLSLLHFLVFGLEPGTNNDDSHNNEKVSRIKKKKRRGQTGQQEAI